MRNLRNVSTSIIDCPLQGPLPTATAWDPATDSLICAFGPSQSSPAIEVKRLDKKSSSYHDAVLIASWDAPSPLHDLPVDKILTLQYFADTATVCLILAGGDLVVVREQPLPGEDLIEIVGSVDAGITAAAWSPDEELLALTTRADTIIFMTRDFESIANSPLSPDDINVSAHVSVGWGKSETQFKGKRAKALRDPTVPEHVDEGILTSLDSGETTITWRGDGAYVAVNSIQDGKRRMIRVYSREGVLESVSEPVDGLEGALSWRPSGNLIAGVQRLSDRVDIIFFERNGLRHGQFSLRLTAQDMQDWASSISLQWNSDSTVLAVGFKDRLQLWTMGNYHYYLKQEIYAASSEEAQASICAVWHPEKALRLAFYSGHSVYSLAYSFGISGGSLVPPNDSGLVAVIDGCNLKITPLRFANVPPPMAFSENEMQSNAVDIAVNRSATRIAVLHAYSLSIFKCNLAKRPLQEPELMSNHPIPQCVPRQIAFAGDEQVAVLCAEANTTTSHLFHLSVEDGDTSPVYDLSRDVALITPSTDHEQICLEDVDGNVYEANEVKDLESGLPSRALAKLPTYCPWVEVWADAEQTIVFGLSSNGTLHAVSKTTGNTASQQRLQVRNCTSFLVTPAHLIYTTTQHLLKFVHLHSNELEIPEDEPEKDERCRSIERGAKLVSVMPTSFSLVLQMPRGNLETIYPRALVLAGIRRSIMDMDYKTAFFACRNHRVDMNILHDYAPQQFMASVLLFVKQLKKVEHVDLFLSQLRCAKS